MTQLGIGVAALNHDSAFQAAYEKGIKKSEYWTYTLKDCVNLIARLPALAARIYRNVYRPGTELPGIKKDLDLVGNYTNMLGYGNNHDLTEYLRLYISIHGDHEGGNASAHTARECSDDCLRVHAHLAARRLGWLDIIRPIYFLLGGSVRPRRSSARVCASSPRSRDLE